MSTFNESKIKRQSAGTSQGGQFANKDHPANDEVGLGGPSSRNQRISPGITFISTSSDAGYRLSPSKNRQIPIHLRQRGGRYLGDHGVTPLYFFPEEFVGTFPGADDAESVRAYAAEKLGARLNPKNSAPEDFIANSTSSPRLKPEPSAHDR